MLLDLVKRTRSIRRFKEEPVQLETLRELVELARLSASAANKQPLKYVLEVDPKKNEEIFGCTTWAVYLKDWPGPDKGERPSAYIAILGDTEIATEFGCDHGIAAQSIMLGATEKGLSGCILGLIKRKRLAEILNVPSKYQILLILALGKPAEQVEIDEVEDGGDIKYWRSEDQVHHVPKRRLDDIIL